MAEGTDTTEEQVPTEVAEDDEVTPGYKAPKKVDLQTIQQLDADDESLVKYKEQLLGAVKDVLDEGGPNVIVKKMIIAPVGRDEIVVDLTGDLSKKISITLKEGVEYTIKIAFRVQREIVSGLRYVHVVAKSKLLPKDKATLMVGSYGPKTEEHIYVTPVETAPSGLGFRGTYSIKSNFTDDDKNSILSWEWELSIKKDWE